MPRTTTVESPGCPQLRALAFDSLGLIKVIEARGKDRSVPKVVDRWGDPDSSKCVLAVSMDDRKFNPLLAVARKNGTIEFFNPLSGDLRVSVSTADDSHAQDNNDAITGLHLFKSQRPDTATRSCTVLTCTEKGNAVLRSIKLSDAESLDVGSPKSWKVCGSGSILCSKVDASENYALFGGKGVEVNLWDLQKCIKSWTAKSPAKDSLGIFTPTWFTSATFLSNDDHRKLVAGTNSHQVRLYDISAQRRPVLSFDFRESTIKAVSEDDNGHTVYVGNGVGDLASFDMRTGKMLGCFIGKCSGSIRSIARHPCQPVIASCGLDSYLRFWDTKTRQLLSTVFLKQHLTAVVFDSGFECEAEVAEAKAEAADVPKGIKTPEETEAPPVKRKKSKENASKKLGSEGSKKHKSTKRTKRVDED